VTEIMPRDGLLTAFRLSLTRRRQHFASFRTR
jgi:hypothetical protein